MHIHAFIISPFKSFKHCLYSNDFCSWVVKHPMGRSNSHHLCPTNTTWKVTYLETRMPFTWRNLNRSWAFSRSLNFSLAVKVSYGTRRGWLPPPEVRDKHSVFLFTSGETSWHRPACFPHGMPRNKLTFAFQLQLLLLGPDIVIVLSHHLHHSLCPTPET